MPKKRFGQHFLTDPAILERIVDFSRVGAGDSVVEIGPGRGALTSRLARRAGSVVAVELDRDLIGPLEASMPSNVRILAADALDIDYRTIAPAGYALVGNLPYNVATPLIERFTAARRAIGSVTVMLQKEVADRIVASPGGKDYGPLTLGVGYYAEVEAGFVLKPGAFSPPPRVDSRMIRLTWKTDVGDAPTLMAFIRTSFRSRRKTLVNNIQSLSGVGRDRATRALVEAGLDPNVRAEDVSLETFRSLHAALGAERPKS